MRRSQILLVLILIAGAILRLGIFSFPFEYDEIWSILYYSARPLTEVFTDIATPNNHPLNSFLMNLLVPFFESGRWIGLYMLRVIPFTAGICSICLTWLIGKKIYRSQTIGTAAAALTALLPFTVEYSSLARGYSLQLFLILLFTWMTLKAIHNRRYFIGMIITGWLSVLTIPTAILFLFPVCAMEFFMIECKRKFREMCPALIAYTLFGMSLFVWYLLNIQKFVHGQMFGKSVDSFSDLVVFFGETLVGTIGLPAAIMLSGALILCLLDWRRKQFAFLFAVICFPIVMSVILKGGPLRVYIPLIPFSGIACAAALTAFSSWKTVKWIPLTCMILFAIPPWFSRNPYLKTDWGKIARKASKADKSIFFVFPANESLTACWNNFSSAQNFINRMNDPKVITLIDNPKLSGASSEGWEKQIPIPLRPEYSDLGGKLTYSWRMLPLTQYHFSRSGIFFLLFPGISQQEYVQVSKTLQSCKGVHNVVFLNNWYSVLTIQPKTKKMKMLLAIQADNRLPLGNVLKKILPVTRIAKAFTLDSFPRKNKEKQK